MYPFLPRLAALDLSKNQLSGIIPLDLASLSLRYLDLSSNSLRGECSAAMAHELHGLFYPQ
jgi:Leucine-rich repeat (LRR) protein